MHPSLPDIYELHQIDTRILELKRAQAALDNGAALKKELDALRARLTTMNTRLRELRSQSQDAELALKTLENKKANHERRLRSGGMTNFKEIEGLEKEIQSLNQSKDELEDKILTLMEEIETLSSETDTLQNKADSLEKRLAEVVTAWKKQKAELDAQIAESSEQRGPVAAKADPAALKRYEDLRARLGTGLSVVENQSCSGCRTSLTAYSLREARESVKLIPCENCNRILYMPEEE